MSANACDGDQNALLPCSVILDTMAGGLFVVDTEHTIRAWNRAMEKLTGYAADEAIGQPCTMLECNAVRDACSASEKPECGLVQGRDEAIEHVECMIRSRSGERIPVLKNARTFLDADGHPAGIVETVTDLRPLKRLEDEVMTLRGQPTPQGLGRLIGKGRAMQEVYERIGLAANAFATVLVHGETGSGKELVAEAIHSHSDRAQGPFVKVNCSALSEGLLESELFGHVKGAFTGAVRDKIGRFEAAGGGTIFLDEIGDISPLIQLKLLRVLQEREIERVGESASRKVDVRVVAATHRDLKKLVQEGTFREDLYYRIRVFDITVPPLRGRREDIPLLVQHFIERFNRETGNSIVGVTAEVNVCFMDYCWPGNVRELENAIEHAFVTSQNDHISLFDLPLELRMMELRAATCAARARQQADTPTPSHYNGSTREGLIEALRAANWNKAEAARLLGVTRTTVWRKMKQWNVPLEEA